MTQKEKLETLTGEKFPDPTPQEFTKIQLQNTPFWIIGNQKQGYNIIMGKYKLNEQPIAFGIFQQQTIEHEILQWLQQNQWNVQLSIAICVTTDLLNNKTNN